MGDHRKYVRKVSSVTSGTHETLTMTDGVANTADNGEEGFEALFDVGITEMDVEPIQQYITKLENG